MLKHDRNIGSSKRRLEAPRGEKRPEMVPGAFRLYLTHREIILSRGNPLQKVWWKSTPGPRGAND